MSATQKNRQRSDQTNARHTYNNQKTDSVRIRLMHDIHITIPPLKLKNTNISQCQFDRQY